MPYVATKFSAIVKNEPAKARKRIIEVLEETGVHREKAASILGCSYETLWRWIAKLGMEDTVEKLRLRAIVEGWHHGEKGGRPLGTARPSGSYGTKKQAAGR